MNEINFVDSHFFYLCLVLSHFCFQSHFKLIRCIVKLLIAISTHFMLKCNRKKKTWGLFWAPEFGHPNWYTSLPSSMNMSMLDRTIILKLHHYWLTLSDFHKITWCHFYQVTSSDSWVWVGFFKWFQRTLCDSVN